MRKLAGNEGRNPPAIPSQLLFSPGHLAHTAGLSILLTRAWYLRYERSPRLDYSLAWQVLSTTGGVFHSNNSDQPDDAERDQDEEARWDQPHQQHSDPAEGAETPTAHHAGPHHPPPSTITAIPAESTQHADADQEGAQQHDAEDGDDRPIDSVHLVPPLEQKLLLEFFHIHECAVPAVIPHLPGVTIDTEHPRHLVARIGVQRIIMSLYPISVAV
jgi:hypothetical protein